MTCEAAAWFSAGYRGAFVDYLAGCQVVAKSGCVMVYDIVLEAVNDYLRCVVEQLHLRHAVVVDAHMLAAGPYQGLSATVVLSPSRRVDTGRVEGGWHEELGWWATALPVRVPSSPGLGLSRPTRHPTVAPIGYLAAPGIAARSSNQASRQCRYLTTALAPRPDRVAEFLLDSHVLGADTPTLHRYRLAGGDADLVALLTRVTATVERSVPGR